MGPQNEKNAAPEEFRPGPMGPMGPHGGTMGPSGMMFQKGPMGPMGPPGGAMGPSTMGAHINVFDEIPTFEFDGTGGTKMQRGVLSTPLCIGNCPGGVLSTPLCILG